ncbi:predicted protein [Histoplasma capsulatum G186AR]|uniref:Uncharacterized protein n=1 Tax=Ajellomyces capsulatus (strain G186AR / H82 / ATCC MYA-2454 / RMSCC 2432) TaxID=447093 RepID=C0P169_AJECG|nr:uncharacterized protein HCBG_09149 [Histoplasma capsulatum G186AR]EEH02584.1 predicted protein [Histoplasma capsulatum G186AR]
MLPAPIGNGLPRIWIMATSLTLFNPRPLLLLQNLFKIVPKISELFTTSRQTSLQKLLSFTAGRSILEALSYLSNILLSGTETNDITIKVRDLGLGERASAIHVLALKEFVAFSKAIRSFQALLQAFKSHWRGSAPPGVQIGHLIPICGGILLFK